MSFYSKRPRDAASFRIFSDSMLQSEQLPLSDVIEDELFASARGNARSSGFDQSAPVG